MNQPPDKIESDAKIAKLLIFFLLSIFVYSLIYYCYHGILQARSGRKTDFDPYISGALCLKNIKNPYVAVNLLEAAKSIGAQKNDISINRCVYPPLFMQLLLPFTKIDISKARVIWSVIFSIFFLICITAAVYQMTGNNLLCSAIFLSMLFLFNPLYITIALGQVNLFIVFLIIYSYYFYKKKLYLISSGFITAAALIKIIPAIFFLPFLVRSGNKNILKFCVASIVLFLISYIYSVAEYNYYFSYVLPQFSGGAGDSVYNISFWGMLDRMNFRYKNIAAFILQGLTLLILLHSLLIKKYENDFIFGLTTCLSLLIPKTLWEHHLLLLAIPIFIMIKYIHSSKVKPVLSRIIFTVAGFALIAMDMKYYDERLNEFPLIFFQYIKFFGLVFFTLGYYLTLTNILEKNNKKI